MKKILIPLVIALVLIAVLFAGCSLRKSDPTESPTEAKPAASQAEIDEFIADWVDRKVREGFETREEIIQGVTEIVDDEYEVSDAETGVTTETDRRLKEHIQSQSSWPDLTDCDRIDKAFATPSLRMDSPLSGTVSLTSAFVSLGLTGRSDANRSRDTNHIQHIAAGAPNAV